MWVGLQRRALRLGNTLSNNSTILLSRATLAEKHHYLCVAARKASTKAEDLSDPEQSNLDLEHSQFISEASRKDRWKSENSEEEKRNGFRTVESQDEPKAVEERRGK